jgi:ketosteroid isomerase-like protein
MSANLVPRPPRKPFGASFRSRDALNALDRETVMLLCTEDGVFMPPQLPVGGRQSRAAASPRRGVQGTTLNVKFTLAEVVTMSPEWAFARTNSGGTNNINATKAVSAEAIRCFSSSEGDGWTVANRPLEFFHDESAVGSLV